MNRIFQVGFGISLFCLPIQANSFPPPGSDPNSDIARFVQSMKTPSGISCCSLSDCRHTSIEIHSDGTRWAWIGKDEYGPTAPNDWMQITDEVWYGTTADGDPPDGRAYICFWGGSVRCAKSGGAS